MRTITILVAALFLGCGSPNDFQPADLSHSQDMAGGGMDDMAQASGDMKMGASCMTYTPSTIAAMRAAGTSGCFQVGAMAPVVTLSVASSSKTGTLALQDSAGGDNSAVIAKCSTTTGTTYPCTALATVAAFLPGHGATVSGYYAKTKSGIETLHIFDTATDSGAAGTVPTAIAISLTDASRMSSLADRKKYYQKVTVTGAAVKVYELAPIALKSTLSCPTTFGFGVIPQTSAATAGPACSGTTAPSPVTGTPDAAEILIDTTFYKGFTYDSDCTCNKAPSVLVAPGDTFTKVGGILGFDGTVTSISPTANADVGK